MAGLTNGTDKQALDRTSESFFKDFIVKNLDTGESFHIDKVDDYLVKTKAKLSMLTPADSKSPVKRPCGCCKSKGRDGATGDANRRYLEG